MLKWIIANGRLLTSKLCQEAASKGRLKVLKWLRKQNCPWNASTYVEAKRKSHQKVAQWMKENGCPQPSESPNSTDEEDY